MKIFFLTLLLPLFAQAQITANLARQLKAARLSPRSLELLNARIQKEHYQKNYAAIVDYTLPSQQPRFFLINLKEQTFKAVPVAHGWNSGGEKAVCFSNKNNSFQSSLGFVRTGALAQGSWHPSLILKGLSASNSNMEKRHIILHSADYSSRDFLYRKGYWGRSQGCLALSQEDVQPVISALGEGSLILNYQDQLWDKSQENPDQAACLPGADPHDIPPNSWEIEENKVGSAFRSEKARYLKPSTAPAPAGHR